jgi:hypothetical protein
MPTYGERTSWVFLDSFMKGFVERVCFVCGVCSLGFFGLLGCFIGFVFVFVEVRVSLICGFTDLFYGFCLI